ncbi:hypothetical protein HXX76_011138 [Chlamydomonas incerta]|uniref:Phosphoglycerate mutase-like protein n=1 Tax=Chlamydomonas incerta TaxID=51695 RepID=A0A835VXD3_CHLIN|nr:hypothetical protein HXX76_011138 [Chlamydomonas incerta]|eukprot:KAG2429373.1 hypothetical protein HXX76_011138 [Chlamydomonas incerta]
MSQTYERTQPDPCIDYPGRDQDQDEEEPELSLRRTQHYHATSSTQPYGQSQNPLQLMSGMPSFSVPMGPGPVLENDLVQAPPSDEAARTTWEAPDAASFTQPTLASLPVDLSLEGQGSNAPGDPTQIPTAWVASTAAPAEHGDALDDTIDFRVHPNAVLPTVSAGPAVTPDIGGCVVGGCASQDVADDGTTPPLQVSVPVYSIFNQGRSRRRPIFLIRHGESEYNAACKKGTGFGDPSDIFDAPLTATGVKQARNLRPQMMDMMLKQGDPLFIVSPLTRAIETFLQLLPDPNRLSLPASPATPSASTAAAVSQRPTQQQDQGGDVTPRGGESVQSLQSKPLDVLICPTLAELLLTSGDVGRPRSVLLEKFPQLATHLQRGLEQERWWYEKGGKGPNCAVTKVLSSTESKADCKVRVDRFKHFLYAQQLKNPQRPIVLVGHANFFKHLMGEANYMDHCVITKWAPA